MVYLFAVCVHNREVYNIWRKCVCIVCNVYVIIRFIMAELLQTERTYVKDLETCIKVWFTKYFETIHQISCTLCVLLYVLDILHCHC